MSVLKAFGEILDGYGQYQAGKAKAKALKAGARMARKEAGIAASIRLEEGDRAAGRAATLAAASGGGLTGSAMAVLDDLGRQAMFNARVATYEGVTTGQKMDFEAKVAKRQGQLALVTSFVKAGATFAGSAGAPAGAPAGAG